MRSALRTLLAALVVMAILPSERISALEVFGNDGLLNTGLIISGPAPGEEEPPIVLSAAQGFTTGSTPYDLQAVRLGFIFPTSTPPVTNYLQIGLYGNSSGAPGSLIGSFSSTPNETIEYGGGQSKMYSFNYSGSLTLGTNQTYWVVVSTNRVASENSITWAFAATGDEGSTGSGSIAYGKNGSGYDNLLPAATMQFTDLNYPNVVSGWQNGNSFFRGVSLGVVVVPEPSTYALGAVGVLVMGAIARRKSRKTGKV